MLMKDKVTGEQVAVKFIERGDKVSAALQRQLLLPRTDRGRLIGLAVDISSISAPACWCSPLHPASAPPTDRQVRGAGDGKPLSPAAAPQHHPVPGPAAHAHAPRHHPGEQELAARRVCAALTVKALRFYTRPSFPGSPAARPPARPQEYASGGELFELMGRRKGRLGEDEARFYFQQLIAGVGHLHAQGVCHRDLKLENTLLDASRPRRLKVGRQRRGPPCL